MACGVTVPVDVTLVCVTKSNIAFAVISFFQKKEIQSVDRFTARRRVSIDRCDNHATHV